MFTPSSTSLPDRFCGCREILSSVCSTRNGGLFLSTFRLQINKHSDSPHLPSREKLLTLLFTGICVGLFTEGLKLPHKNRTNWTQSWELNDFNCAANFTSWCMSLGRLKRWEDNINMIFTDVWDLILRHPSNLRYSVLISTGAPTIVTEFFFLVSLSLKRNRLRRSELDFTASG
jgi:hypothetical protein